MIYPAAMLDALRAAIRDIPDFPKAGIVFKDITPVLSDGALFRQVIDALAAPWTARPASPRWWASSRAASSSPRRWR